MSNEDRNAVASTTSKGDIKRLISWQNLRDLAVAALIVVLAIKLTRAEWTLNIDRFSFTDLLALLLAMFSVWLSVLFYFKADEGSKRFYNDSYAFTRDISVVLGRIEERFGERLSSLSDQYGGLREDLGKTLAAATVEEKKEEVNQAKEAVVSIASEIAKQDGLGEAERSELLERLRVKDQELEKAHEALNNAQDAMSLAGVSGTDVQAHRAVIKLADCISDRRYKQNGLRLTTSKMTDSQLSAASSEFVRTLSPEELHALSEKGWLSKSGGPLSSDGVLLLRAELLSKEVKKRTE